MINAQRFSAVRLSLPLWAGIMHIPKILLIQPCRLGLRRGLGREAGELLRAVEAAVGDGFRLGHQQHLPEGVPQAQLIEGVG